MQRTPDDDETEGLEEFEEFDERQRDEFEDLNSSTASATFLDQRWWKWAGLAIAGLILLTFMLPLFSPFFDRSPTPSAAEPDTVTLPDFVLPTAYGSTLRLSDELRSHDVVVLVFYRGYF